MENRRIYFDGNIEYTNIVSRVGIEECISDINEMEEPLYEDIEDIIELHILLEFLKDSNDERFYGLKDIVSQIIGKFLNTKKLSTFTTNYNELSYEYQKIFWKLISDYSVFREISVEEFQDFIDRLPVV